MNAVPNLLPKLPDPSKADLLKSKKKAMTERQAVRLEMKKLNDRIFEGFKNRAKYQQARRDTAGEA